MTPVFLFSYAQMRIFAIANSGDTHHNKEEGLKSFSPRG